MENVSKAARKEIVEAVRTRYEQASKLEKGSILSEFTAVSGYHRKHAIRLLNPQAEVQVAGGIEGERVYDEAVKVALVLIWETADRICGKRLKAAIPQLMKAMEKHGHLELDPEVREKLIAVSAATIDRMLTPLRKGAGMRRRRRLAKKLTKEIPIKTFADWQDPLPGFLEIDFVVHGGGSMAGEYLHSLVATDVCSGWVEAVALLAREQTLVIEGLTRIGKQLPVPTKGIDSDNDGAFINETLASYCKREQIVFTRSRPHHKNDQAWIEQKNGAVIRRMVGHERFSGIVAGQALAQLLGAVRLYVNYYFSLACLNYGAWAKRVRRIGKRSRKLDTGGPERIRSKMFGPTYCFGFKKNRTALPRSCCKNWTKSIRASSAVNCCEHSSDGSANGGGLWRADLFWAAWKEWADVQAIAATVPPAGQAALRLATLASALPAPQGEQVC